jgi:hypothetical protein
VGRKHPWGKLSGFTDPTVAPRTSGRPSMIRGIGRR